MNKETKKFFKVLLLIFNSLIFITACVIFFGSIIEYINATGPSMAGGIARIVLALTTLISFFVMFGFGYFIVYMVKNGK